MAPPSVAKAGRTAFPILTAIPFLTAATLGDRIPLRLCLGAMIVSVSFLRTGWATRAARIALILLAPLLPIQLLSVTLEMRGSPQAAPTTLPSGKIAAAARPRIVWLIFDELDATLTFSGRPASVHMPAFDRLRSETFYALDSMSPATMTMKSIPALTIGQAVADARVVGKSELELESPNDPVPHEWKAESSVFQSARAMGVKTALVGWYLPYCAVLGSALDYCHAVMNVNATSSVRKVEYDSRLSVFAAIENYVKEEWSAIPAVERHLLANEYVFVRQQQAAEYLEIRADALRLAGDPNYGLLMIHWPVPHPMGIYDRFKQKLTTDSRAGYLDNLELADRTLAEVRQAMEAAGVWDDSIVLVTGDHGFRPYCWSGVPGWSDEDAAAGALAKENRVPFLLKMPYQQAGRGYSSEFNTILTRDLFLAMLNGEVRDAQAVGEWIDEWSVIHGAGVS
jgi:hypothetical protein